MIEIAISLAVIGFAMVAIIGILPTGMNVQRENREETIINQDATVLINALRGGARQLDDLTNYVTAITNYVSVWTNGVEKVQNPAWWYTKEDSVVGPEFSLTNGFRIIGLMSTPKIAPVAGGGFYSNYVVTYLRSMSGPASEKPPQNSPAIINDLTFSYRVVAEVSAYGTNFFDPAWTNLSSSMLTNEFLVRSNYMLYVKNLEANLHEMRLTFRWPILPNGDAGPGRQMFRTLVGGSLMSTNDPFVAPTVQSTLYFFQPRTYVQTP